MSKKKLDSKTKYNIVGIILGSMLFLLGLGLILYTANQYWNWERIEVTHNSNNCEIRQIQENVDGKRQTVKHKYCDEVISYQYKGEEYTQVDKDNKISNDIELFDLIPPKYAVNPENPKEIVTTTHGYILKIILLLFGGLLALANFMNMRKRNHKAN